MAAGPPPQVMVLGQHPGAGSAVEAALGYLTQVQSMIIRQKIKWGEVLTGCDQRNRYRVMAKPPGFSIKNQENVISQLPPFFNMKERSECCERLMCGPMREFEIDVFDPQNVPVFRFRHEFECTLYFPCCTANPQHIEVFDGMNQLMGRVVDVFDCGLNCCMGRRWHVTDSTSQLKFQLVAETCQCGPNFICEEWVCDIQDPSSGQKIGDIKNCFPGCCTLQACAKIDNFEINCLDPARFTPVDKVLLLGAVILIDFMMFERRQQDNDINAGAFL